MGLERLALILQGKASIFETDVFAPLVKEVLGQRPGRGAAGAAAVRDARIIADHVRALTFAVAEGSLPGNEGAGYVLRRLLRRAVNAGSAGGAPSPPRSTESRRSAISSSRSAGYRRSTS
jgi:alanyl-tRNA synthetase